MTRRWTLGCPGGKRRFPDVLSANLALDAIWRYAVKLGTTDTHKLPCRSYSCYQCKGWHHTSQPFIRTRTPALVPERTLPEEV